MTIKLLDRVHAKQNKPLETTETQSIPPAGSTLLRQDSSEDLLKKHTIYTQPIIDKLIEGKKVGALRYFLSIVSLKIDTRDIQAGTKPQLEFAVLASPFNTFSKILEVDELKSSTYECPALVLAYYEKVINGYSHTQIQEPNQLSDLYRLAIRYPKYANEAKSLISQYFDLVLSSNSLQEDLLTEYQTISSIWTKFVNSTENNTKISAKENATLNAFFNNSTRPAAHELQPITFHAFKREIHETVTNLAKTESELKNLSLYYSFFSKSTKQQLISKVTTLKSTLDQLMTDYNKQFIAGDVRLKKEFLDDGIYPPTSRDYHILKQAIDEQCVKANGAKTNLAP